MKSEIQPAKFEKYRGTIKSKMKRGKTRKNKDTNTDKIQKQHIGKVEVLPDTNQ
jgi:hypothetical protein